MTFNDPKSDLHRYLQMARETMLWKLEDLSEYDIRRPLTPTGTNLLGLVKHLACVEAGYFGEVFGRPFADRPDWMNDAAEEGSDMWATAAQSREDIVGLYRRVWAHADATIDELPLDALGTVGWWAEDRRVATLQRILLHMIAETNRHAGHADIVRELVDGAVGHRREVSNMSDGDAEWWRRQRERIEGAARETLAPTRG